MDFKYFIDHYDNPNSVVLLEGKRDVKEQDKEKLVTLGRILASSSKHIKFRSGNAEGSDFFFSSGVADIDPSRLEVITPYGGHRSKANKAAVTIPLDQINLSNESDIISLSKTNKKTERLINDFVSGIRNQYTMKAAYIIRDTVKVTGTSVIPPATFAVFYDDTDNPETGGTGHTMNVCKLKGVEFIDQKTWFEWLYQN